MNETFKKLAENNKPNPEIAKKYTGGVCDNNYVWMNMLIKFNPLTGKGEVIRSFSRPAQESQIKSMTKPKKKIEKSVFDKTKKPESVETNKLF